MRMPLITGTKDRGIYALRPMVVPFSGKRESEIIYGSES